MDFDRATPQELSWRIAQLEGELDREKRLRKAIEQSTFWKLTSPLRRLLAPFSSLRNKLGSNGAVVPNGQEILPSNGKLPYKLESTPLFAEAGDRLQHNFVFVTFEWEQTARPCDIGTSQDSRALAAGFRSLTILSKGITLARVSFGIDGNSLSHVCYGFSFIEGWGTWTQGGESCVLLWLPETLANHLVLSIDAGSYSDAFSTVACRVRANGREIGRMAFGEESSSTLEFDLSTVVRPISGTSKANLSLVEDVAPDVSVIILNYNKPGITLASVISLLASKSALTFEIIVLDNGSNNQNARELQNLNLPVRLIRLFVNRYFGEGNNIAAEHARGKTLLFLNNDAFVEDHTIDMLSESLWSSDDVGATGPIFYYPDGAIQEAGAFINRDGTAYQRGKGVTNFDVQQLEPIEPVDYVSAACVMVRKDDFVALGGFDLRYDPAYYEDSDLCLRLLAIGKATILVRDARVRHIENATTSDPRNRGIATDIVERHRQIFLSRWGDWLLDRNSQVMPRIEKLDVDCVQKAVSIGKSSPTINAVYSPFPMVLGGGERYLLGSALVLRAKLPTAFVTPDEYSAGRLCTLMQGLGYPTGQLFPEVERNIINKQIDTFVLMGNELLPTRAGYGANRIYHCQFPFPVTLEGSAREIGFENLMSYKCVVVNSEFTKNAYERELAAIDGPRIDVHVIYPPVQLLDGSTRTEPKENLILSIGRFSPHGHSKRQDLILGAMKHLRKTNRLKGWKLILCGMVPNEPACIRYYERILEMADGLPVEIVLSPSRQQLEQLLLRSKVYVSATGATVRSKVDDWRCEHFGITVVEATSAGCIPVGYHLGGPAEIIKKLGVGATFKTNNDLSAAIEKAAIQAEIAAMRQAAINGAKRFDQSTFDAAWQKLIE
jgi:GT2 family glycosyltransferase/glycosyltransferase involved in cell wall biosynthesis